MTSFGEVLVSLFLSAPDTITVPVRVFNYVDQIFDPTENAISVIFIIFGVHFLLSLSVFAFHILSSKLSNRAAGDWAMFIAQSAVKRIVKMQKGMDGFTKNSKE